MNQQASTSPHQTEQPCPVAVPRKGRRRWGLAMFLGLLLGTAAAAAVFWLIPPQFVTASIISISANPVVLLEPAEVDEDFETVKKSHMYRATSNMVLSMALEQPVKDDELVRDYKKIADLPLLRAQGAYPADWLGEHIMAVSNQEEYFQIEMTHTERPSEMAEIVNAVTDVYLRHYANEDKDAQRKRSDQLEKLSAEYASRIEKKRHDIDRLARALGVTHERSISREELAYKQFVTELNNLWVELTLKRNTLELKGRIRERLAEEMPQDKEALKELVEILIAQEPAMIELEGESAKLQEEQAKGESEDGLDEQLKASKAKIEELKAELRPVIEKRLRLATEGVPERPISEQIQAIDVVLQVLEAELSKRRQTSTARTFNSRELDMLEDEGARLEEKQTMINDLIESVKIELHADDRVQLWQPAVEPETADRTSQYRKMAVAGGGVWLLTFASVVLFGPRRRRTA